MNLKIVVIFTLLFQFSAFSQTENDPICQHTIRHKNTPPLLEYLFKKYGVEHTEKILLNVKAFEFENNIHVLFSSEYNLLMEKFNLLIEETTDLEYKNELLAKSQKFKKFEDIESFVNN